MIPTGSVNLPRRPHAGVVTKVTLPAPTAWPIVLAFGFTLLMAGLVTGEGVGSLGGGSGIAEGFAAAGNVSGFGGNQRRAGRRRGDGGAGVPLWVAEPAQHLVSDQFAGGDGVYAVDLFWDVFAGRISCRELFSGTRNSPADFVARRLAIRSHAADVSAPADSAGWDHRADSVDRAAL